MGANASDQALVYLDAGRPREALEVLGLHLASTPDDVRALCLTARALIDAGDRAQAAASAQRALSLSPENEWAWRLLAIARTDAGQFDAARKAAARAREIAPWNWQTHFQVAAVDVSAKHVTPATQAAASRAAELAPNEAMTHFMVGNVALANKDLTGAEKAYRRALALDPHMPAAQNNLSLVIMRRGATGAAAAGFVDILANDPTSELARRNTLAAIASTVAQARFVLGAGVIITSMVHVAALTQGGGTGYSESAQFGGAMVAAGVGLAWIVLGVRFVAGAGVRLRRILRAAWRFDRWICWIAALALAVYAALVLAAAMPASGDGWGQLAILLYVCLLGLTFVRRARRDRK